MALPPGIKSRGGQLGVPTPYVAHVHPYPTRYHGGIWTRPVFEFPYAPSPQSVFKPDDFTPDAYSRYPWAAKPTNGLGQDASPLAMVQAVGGLAGMILGAYHGYRRDDSVGWAIGWALFGSMFWPIAIPVMLVQGLGKPEAHQKNRARRKLKRGRKR